MDCTRRRHSFTNSFSLMEFARSTKISDGRRIVVPNTCSAGVAPKRTIELTSSIDGDTYVESWTASILLMVQLEDNFVRLSMSLPRRMSMSKSHCAMKSAPMIEITSAM